MSTPAPLPRLVLIADGFTAHDVADRAVTAARAGVPWVHLRDHEAGPRAFRRAAAALAERLRETGARISVNTNVDVADKLGTGVHVGRRGPSVADARQQLQPASTVGFSAHEADELTDPQQARADYYFLGPIFPTGSKPDDPGLGLHVLYRAAAATQQPVYALGGVTPARVSPCLGAGAYGVAVLSGILHADDVADAAEQYLTALDTHTPDLPDAS